jgi:hypothetical protein
MGWEDARNYRADRSAVSFKEKEEMEVHFLDIHKGRFKVFILTVHFILDHPTEIVKIILHFSENSYI